MSLINRQAYMVHNALKDSGIETPFFNKNKALILNQKKIEGYMNKILCLLNLDIKNENLSKTPERISKMYVEEIFFGLDYNNFPKINLIKNEMNFNEMLTVRNICFTTICEHHFLIIDGKATISYLPKNRLIGLSKINKIVYFFSKRPQVQERFTKQILVSLQTLLSTNNVAVSVDAIHYCVKARGIGDYSSRVKTTSFGGFFKSDTQLKEEFLYNVLN